jgi:hypothetical protein
VGTTHTVRYNTEYSTHFSHSVIILYSIVNSHSHILWWQFVIFTPSTGCSLWGAKWILRTLPGLESFTVTRISPIVKNSFIPDRKQKYQQNALLGISIFSFLEIFSWKSVVNFTTDKTAVTTLNKFRYFQRSSQLFREITRRSFVIIPWSSTLKLLASGVSSSTKHIDLNEGAVLVGYVSWNARGWAQRKQVYMKYGILLTALNLQTC